MTARRNARPSVKVGAQVRFRGVKWQVVALSGQTIHLVGPDGGGGEAVLAGYLFADPGFSVIGADVPQAAPQWGLFETAPPRHVRRHWPGSGTYGKSNPAFPTGPAALEQCGSSTTQSGTRWPNVSRPRPRS
ncbi:hypothetical protein ABZ371_15800 [Streptomyces sp. NPDC005899]|uniref:hypothetical protein n=1 Tax=Streptomyces sp. NPDC005899 TaxID=3155716 RepID=UPI0033CBE718